MPSSKMAATGVAASTSGGAPSGAATEHGHNVGLFARVTEAMQKIFDHHLFENIVEDNPMGLPTDGQPVRKKTKKSADDVPAGVQAAFDSYSFDMAMSDNGSGIYRCACNEFWLDPFFSFMNGVPINVTNVENLQRTAFAEPNAHVGTTVVLVDSKSMDPNSMRGALKRLSPEEPWLAKVLRLAQVIEEGADDDTLMQWRVAMLSASWQFELFENGFSRPTEGALDRAINLREQMVSEGLAVGRDAVQRIFEVHNTRKALEAKAGGARVSNERLAEHYKKNIRLNPRAEPVTATFVESASVLYSHMLRHTDLLAIIRQMQELHGANAPLNSSAKLRVIASKADKQHHLILFALTCIADMTESNHMATGEITERQLRSGLGSNRGLCELLFLKHDIRKYFLYSDLRTRGVSPQHQDAIQHALASFASYRLKLNPMPGTTDPDRTWMAMMSQSTRALVNTYADVIYGHEHDATLRVAVRAGMGAQDTCNSGSIKQALDEIEAASKREAEATKATMTSVALSMPACGPAPTSTNTPIAPSNTNDVVETSHMPENTREEEAETWTQTARASLTESVFFLCDSEKSEATLKNMLTNSNIATHPCDTTGVNNMLVMYDSALSGESITAPHLRSPPFRKEHFNRIARAILGARKKNTAQICNLSVGDVFLFHDAGKPTTLDAVQKVFVKEKGRFSVAAKAEQMSKHTVHIFWAEENLKQRRALTRRGVASLKQLSCLHYFHNVATCIPEVPRKFFPGSNQGSVLGPMHYEAWTDSWKLSLEAKKALYGPENRRPVGGRSDGTTPHGDDDEDDPEDDAQPMDDTWRPTFPMPLVGGGRGSGHGRPDGTLEPAFWHQLPVNFYKEVMVSTGASCVLDCTPGSGNAALAALDLQVGYLGICFNEEHRKLLQAHLVEKVLLLMRQEGHPLYNATYTQWFSGGVAPAEAPQAALANMASKAPAAKGKAKSKANAASKRAAAKSAPATTTSAVEVAAVPTRDTDKDGDNDPGFSLAALLDDAIHVDGPDFE